MPQEQETTFLSTTICQTQENMFYLNTKGMESADLLMGSETLLLTNLLNKLKVYFILIKLPDQDNTEAPLISDSMTKFIIKWVKVLLNKPSDNF